MVFDIRDLKPGQLTSIVAGKCRSVGPNADKHRSRAAHAYFGSILKIIWRYKHQLALFTDMVAVPFNGGFDLD
jgi:hypothetical protein